MNSQEVVKVKDFLCKCVPDLDETHITYLITTRKVIIKDIDLFDLVVREAAKLGAVEKEFDKFKLERNRMGLQFRVNFEFRFLEICSWEIGLAPRCEQEFLGKYGQGYKITERTY